MSLPVPGLGRPAVPSTVMGDRPVPVLGEEVLLRLPAVGVERPAVAEDDRTARAPVPEEDLCAVVGQEGAHDSAHSRTWSASRLDSAQDDVGGEVGVAHHHDMRAADAAGPGARPLGHDRLGGRWDQAVGTRAEVPRRDRLPGGFGRRRDQGTERCWALTGSHDRGLGAGQVVGEDRTESRWFDVDVAVSCGSSGIWTHDDVVQQITCPPPSSLAAATFSPSARAYAAT